VEKVSETVGLPVEKVLEVTGLPPDTPLDRPIKEITDDEAFRETLAEWFAAEKDSPAETKPMEVPNPDEIKGSMTMEQVASTWGLDAAAVFEKAGWPGELPADKPLKEIATELGKDVSEIREAVKELIEKR